MRAADDEIVIAPFFGNLCKDKRRIACGHNNGILLHILGCLGFGKTSSPVDGIEQKIIVVGRFLAEGKFIFTAVTKFFDIEWKSFCDMTFFCGFTGGKFRKRTVWCAHVNTPKSEKRYLCKSPNDIIAFSL